MYWSVTSSHVCSIPDKPRDPIEKHLSTTEYHIRKNVRIVVLDVMLMHGII